MNEDIRLVLINPEGELTVIFSNEDITSSNSVVVTKEENIDKISDYYDTIQDKKYKGEKFFDKHLTYLQSYLENNYVEEFKSVNYDPLNCSSDVLLYYFLSTFGVVVLINSSEHINAAIFQNDLVTDNQKDRIKECELLFNKQTCWDINGNVHFDIIEEDGKKYRILNYDDSISGDYRTLVDYVSTKKTL